MGWRTQDRSFASSVSLRRRPWYEIVWVAGTTVAGAFRTCRRQANLRVLDTNKRMARKSTQLGISRLVVGVCGGSGSGKTTLCVQAARLLEAAGIRVASLSCDNYYRTLNTTEMVEANAGRFNFDHPSSLDLALLAEQLQDFRIGRAINVPEYSHAENSRLDHTRMISSAKFDVLLLDGLFILWDEAVRSELDFRVFLEVKLNDCLMRRTERDSSERHRCEISVAAQWDRTVCPGFEAFVGPSAIHADLVVHNTQGDGMAAAEHIAESVVAEWRSSRRVSRSP